MVAHIIKNVVGRCIQAHIITDKPFHIDVVKYAVHELDPSGSA
jgi:transposase